MYWLTILLKPFLLHFVQVCSKVRSVQVIYMREQVQLEIKFDVLVIELAPPARSVLAQLRHRTISFYFLLLPGQNFIVKL